MLITRTHAYTGYAPMGVEIHTAQLSTRFTQIHKQLEQVLKRIDIAP